MGPGSFRPLSIGLMTSGQILVAQNTDSALVPPSGSGIAAVTCTNSQSADPSSNFGPTCSRNISAIGQDIYLMHLAESAVCSYAGSFYSNSSSVYVYTPAFLNTLWSGLLSYKSVDPRTGNLQTVQLSPDNVAHGHETSRKENEQHLRATRAVAVRRENGR